MVTRKNQLVISIILMLLATVVFAQERTIVTVGGSWWNAAYSYEDEDGNKLADIGSGNSVGPYISINHGKVNFGASLLFGSFPVEEYNVGLEEVNEEVDMSRNDLNFTLGYRVHRYINIFLGVKYLKWSTEMNIEDYPLDAGYDNWGYPLYEMVDISYEDAVSGPLYGLGVSAVVPIGSEGLYLFGSLAGMGGTLTNETTFEAQGRTNTTDNGDLSTTLATINLGLGYRFDGGLGINAGYRADLFTLTSEYEILGETIENDVNIGVKGLIVTASYSF
ncbi:MAG TPA: outer membrane beta-barrel protein [bacterium]|mgnify:CR=1 FL=1|nr:outer membrane beta-barrel protein [bacterium]HPN44494.1 outer membrane beta-barrel protein [bacterium]